MTIEINDYDGIISLVNSETYKTFVDKDWELEQLKNHFIHQMNLNSLIVWQTNNFGGSYWKVKFNTIESNEIAHSEFNTSIEVTEGKLYLADYTDLTMCAQFEEYKIPAKKRENQYIEIENGKYQVKVKRLFNPDENLDEDKFAFEIVLTKTEEIIENPIDKIFWWTF
jgi:hypothetical protein